jgi:hypothetical protein
LGTHTAVLSWSTSGIPPDFTRRAVTVQEAVTQGDGEPGGSVNGQPATVYVVAWPMAA